MKGTRPAAHKTWTPIEFKLDAEGEGTFVAVFATLEVWDSQDDWTERGAIGTQKVVISQWNHGSWDRGVAGLPIGVGEISEQGNKAVVKGEFDLSDEDALRTYQKLKYLVSKGRNVEWSYALPEVEWAMEERDGRRGRVIKKVRVPEVSPVLLGAGVDTELLSIKSDAQPVVAAPAITVHTIAAPGTTQKQIASKRLVDHIAEAVESVKSVARRVTIVRALRESEGRQLSKAATEHLGTLRGSLHDATKALDGLLTTPETKPEEHDASEELRRIEVAHEERKRAWH